MKILITFIAALLLLTSAYAGKPNSFTLPIEQLGQEERILHNSKDWYYVGNEKDYKVHIEKSMLNEKQTLYEFHSVTEFDKPHKYSIIKEPVKRIYSYGILNCAEANLYLLGDLFADKNNIIVYRQYHEFGSYITNLSGDSTVRSAIYNVLCKETI
jgi:hypothetical protein